MYKRQIQYGLKVVKFFPAESFGGISTIKALVAPYPKLKFMPTGGINLQNLEKYLGLDAVIACGGSWMVRKSLIQEGKFDEIKVLTAETVRLVAQMRGK